jgi:glucose/arabinose dehydrogenase
MPTARIALILLLIAAPAFTDEAKPGIGPRPNLPDPQPSAEPTVKVAPAIGWTLDAQPTPASGLRVNAFAKDLDHPRNIYVLPNNDILVAETNRPSTPETTDPKMEQLEGAFKKAGAVTKSANRITLLRDANHDGFAEIRTAFLENLNSPFGMALIGDQFYVANTDALVVFPYKLGDTRISAEPKKVIDLPANAPNYHWTRDIVATPDGARLYVDVGSNSNVGDNGIDAEEGRAAIWEVDPATNTKRLFATGLRNPAAIDWNANTNTLWAAVNERDDLGDELVPDYLVAVREDGFYGWPYTYWGNHPDTRIQPKNPELLEGALAPDYGLGAHVAALGLAFTNGNALNDPFEYGAFVGEHGSWNRTEFSGYKVVFIRFRDGMPEGDPIDVLTGFLTPDGRAQGRPVAVALSQSGALLVADDVGNCIWRVVSDAAAAPEEERTNK